MNNFFPKWRVITFSVISILMVLVLLARYTRLSFASQEKIIPRKPSVERGSIVDRNGKPLAVETHFYHMGVNPQKIKNPEQFAKDVGPALGMSEAEILETIRDALENRSARFTYLKKKMPLTTYEEVKKITDEKKYNMFVSFDKIPGRIYPENTLASQLIGFMGDDGRGLAGIEYSMQKILSPDPKILENGKIEQGKNIYLTIDANLQYKLTQIARAALEETQGANLMLLAAYAKTGEILAYLSLPEANLNEYTSAGIEETIDRPAITFFEPGSVFKVFTIAAAYDAGLFSQDESFLCDGVFEKVMPSGERLRLNCLSHHGYLTARGALEQSCNDVTAQITDRMETSAFLSKLRAFGFGQRTGVQLPSESPGLFQDQSSARWSGRSKMTISIGQEVGVTALQVIEAATVLANDGHPLKLSVISKITDNEGNAVFQNEVERMPAVISSQTARYILSCMQTGAEKGIGWRANVGDMTIGVKTGTAQMVDAERGGYSQTDFLSDALAFFPAEDPEIILYIVIQKSQGINFASRIVAPVIKDSANAIIDHLGMSRGDAASLAHSGRISIQGKAPLILGKTLPDLTGLSKRELLTLLSRKDLNVNINGSGWVTRQSPPAGTPITEGMQIDLYLE
ncbi:MAG: transpeptidase family protein [Treponema sp.]|nr:transpeptidase family protein [Treponema sp.]